MSSRLFLLTDDDTVYRLADAAFMRMLRQEDVARLPDFAGQRVRLASFVVETADRVPLRVLHAGFSVVDIGTDGLLDVARLNMQQAARAETLMAGVLGERHWPRALSPEAARGNRTISCCVESNQRL